MNKDRPVGSKYLTKIWQEFDKQVHKQKLRDMESSTVNLMQEPSRMPHLNQNGKKLVVLDQKYTEIERENHMLLK